MSSRSQQTRSRRSSSRADAAGSSSKSPSRQRQLQQQQQQSPGGPTRDSNLPDARQVRVSIARLEMPKDNPRKTPLRSEMPSGSNGYTASPSADVRPRRSIRSVSNSSGYYKPTVESENTMPSTLRSGYKPSYQSPSSTTRDDASSRAKDRKRRDFSPSKPQEWAGSVGALLLTLSMPICLPLMQLACTNDHCGLENFRIAGPSEWLAFFDLNAFLYYAGYLCFLVIMSVLPIGRIVESWQSKDGTLQYRINGLYTLILAVSIFAGLEYQGYDVHNYLIKNSLKLTLVGLVYGLILSIALYVKSSRVPASDLNEYAATNSFIYNFWQGREINPRFGPIDVKQVLFESTVIGTDLINLAAAVKIFKEADSLSWTDLNITALTVISLQMVFFVDKLIFEARFLSTFEMTYEGMGYMLGTGYLIYPYISTLSTRYLLVHKVQLPSYLIAFWVVVFFVGYWLYRASNNQKDEFRKNPFSPAVAHLVTIPTPAGKRLIASGYWGFVRRPNYLGDILMHLAWAFLGFAPDLMPYVLAIFTTLLLVHRAIRDEARCEKRYRFAWTQYCERVKYIILPPIF